MLSLEMCHLLNNSFYFAIYTFVLEFVLFTPWKPWGEILYPRIPGGESCERGGFPNGER